jgi:glycosyltransferase involved in cell wall biosynthesis
LVLANCLFDDRLRSTKLRDWSHSFVSRNFFLRSKLAIITEIIAPYRIPVFNALAKRSEVDLHVIFLSENDPGLRQWHVYKNEIEFEYEVLPAWRWRFAGFNILINRGVTTALRRFAPDVILCGGYNYFASWQAAYWARARKVPLILWTESTASDARARHRLIEYLKTHFLHLCQSFVVPGIASANYLRELGISQDRIFIAPNAIDNGRYAHLAEEARKKESQVRAKLSLPARYFLYVGRLIKAKGVFDLLEAYSQMDAVIRSAVGLVLVGDGADRDELMRTAVRIKTGNIQFAGFIQRDELAQFYTFAEGLVFPTHSDTWGLVVNEAMSCGLPVIVADVAGCTADLVQDGWNGFVVPPGKTVKFAAMMTQLASDPSLRREMGARSRQRIEAYSPESWSEGIVKATAATRQANP